MMSMNLNDIAVLNISDADYCCIIKEFSKSEAVNLQQNVDLSKHKNLLSHLKMGKEIMTFEDIVIKKHKFHRYKGLIFFEDIDINNILVSNKISFDEKTINSLLVTHAVIINIRYYT